MEAKDKDGWPIVPGARVRIDFPYQLTNPDGEAYRPTHEGVVLRIISQGQHPCLVESRDTDTYGTYTTLPGDVRVMRGDSKKSAVYREMTDASYRKVRAARKG